MLAVLQVLADLLIGKRVQLDVTETAFYRKFGGEQSPLDLELTFQMIHRLFTHTVQPIPEELQTCLKYGLWLLHHLMKACEAPSV